MQSMSLREWQSVAVGTQLRWDGELLQQPRSWVASNHLSTLNWFGKLYIKVTCQNGRPNCLDGHEAVGKASLGRSSQDLKQSTIMINHAGGSRPAPNTVSARTAIALHLSAFKIYWKNMEEQDFPKKTAPAKLALPARTCSSKTDSNWARWFFVVVCSHPRHKEPLVCPSLILERMGIVMPKQTENWPKSMSLGVECLPCSVPAQFKLSNLQKIERFQREENGIETWIWETLQGTCPQKVLCFDEENNTDWYMQFHIPTKSENALPTKMTLDDEAMLVDARPCAYLQTGAIRPPAEETMHEHWKNAARLAPSERKRQVKLYCACREQFCIASANLIITWISCNSSRCQIRWHVWSITISHFVYQWRSYGG